VTTASRLTSSSSFGFLFLLGCKPARRSTASFLARKLPKKENAGTYTAPVGPATGAGTGPHTTFTLVPRQPRTHSHVPIFFGAIFRVASPTPAGFGKTRVLRVRAQITKTGVPFAFATKKIATLAMRVKSLQNYRLARYYFYAY
jgi:hypothetical protein